MNTLRPTRPINAGLIALIILCASPNHAAREPLPSSDDIAKLPSDGGPDFNRLVFEQSPYLLQHARNPVDWHPWGEEAFAKAHAEDKPVFLSIGYSTCHWCHVMEHESFEDEAVAAVINDLYIPIKVDREERPDLDSIYMKVTQAMHGSGGWPMTVIMTPDKVPFFAGTYFPKDGQPGRPGMFDILPALSEAWKNNREAVTEQTEAVQNFLNRTSGGLSESATMPSADVLDKAAAQLAAQFDADHGGFGAPPRMAPKFPTPHNLTFLLRAAHRTGDQAKTAMVNDTLAAMRLGGIYDHVGFGFHRYATDREWLVPHFEKMLYDQALVGIAYVDAWHVTGNKPFADTARKIYEYVLRDMVSEEGGFYSAEDADSEGVEGKFYVWSEAEIDSLLGDAAELFKTVYNITSEGNFLDEATHTKTGANIIYLQSPLAQIASDLEMPLDTLESKIESSRQKLYAHREKRIHPLKDDKILTDWNGLMIASLANAGRVLGDPDYTNAATQSTDFVLDNLKQPNGRLLHRYRKGEAGLPGVAEDYAYFTWGLIELYQATLDPRYLQEAVELTAVFIEHYWDEEGGAFFQTADDAEKLITRLKDSYDGARPSANSVAALNLARLARMTGNMEYEKKAGQILTTFGEELRSIPSGHTHMLQALDFLTAKGKEIVIVGDPLAEDTKQMLKLFHSEYRPNTVILLKPTGDESKSAGETIERLAPFTKTQSALNNAATAYVCENFACKAPIKTVEELEALLGESPAE